MTHEMAVETLKRDVEHHALADKLFGAAPIMAASAEAVRTLLQQFTRPLGVVEAEQMRGPSRLDRNGTVHSPAGEFASPEPIVTLEPGALGHPAHPSAIDPFSETSDTGSPLEPSVANRSASERAPTHTEGAPASGALGEGRVATAPPSSCGIADCPICTFDVDATPPSRCIECGAELSESEAARVGTYPGSKFDGCCNDCVRLKAGLL